MEILFQFCISQDTRLEKDEKNRRSIPQAFSTEEASRISDALYSYEVMCYSS
jgi:la-related protein 1